MNLATLVTVEGDYLQTMGIPLLSGRFFTADTASSQLVAIVNHKLAEHCWPGANPVGKRLRLGLQETNPTPWVTIVGEVADVKEASPDVPSKEQYYEPVEQFEKSLAARGGKGSFRSHQMIRFESFDKWENATGLS